MNSFLYIMNPKLINDVSSQLLRLRLAKNNMIFSANQEIIKGCVVPARLL